MKKIILFILIASFVFVTGSVFALKSEIQVTDVEKVFIKCSPKICTVDIKSRFKGPISCPVYTPNTIPVKVTPRYLERRVITPNWDIPPVVTAPIPVPPVYYNPYMQPRSVCWRGLPECRGFLRGLLLIPANVVNAVLQVPQDILY